MKLAIVLAAALWLGACSINSQTPVGVAGAIVAADALTGVKAVTATVSQSVVPATKSSDASALAAVKSLTAK